MYLRVLMYTYGMASGHLSRVNALYKGFLREGHVIDFYAVAPRTKYSQYLEVGIKLIIEEEAPPNVDIFICDWKATEWVLSLPEYYSKIWIGLRRLGTIKSNFPEHFDLIGIEPGVKSNITIWPILSTWKDELLDKSQFYEKVGLLESQPVALMCENGAFADHPEKVFQKEMGLNKYIVLKSSNNPYCSGEGVLDYYPVAKLFGQASKLILGAGYNSVHEAICFSSRERVMFVIVGGDDQRMRMARIEEYWDTSPGDSQAHVLVRVIVDKLGEGREF